MTARKLTVNVVVLDDTHNVVVLEAGSEVPSWASDQVGDHCFAKADVEGEKTAPGKRVAK